MNNALLANLRQVAFDRYLALWLAPAEARDFLLALFSLEQELLSLPDKVSNPTLGVMRVTWWRDALLALGEKPAPANPILQALATYSSKAALLADYAETFDAPFYEEDRDQRVRHRADVMAALLADRVPVPLPAIRRGVLAVYTEGPAEHHVPPFLGFLAESRGRSRLHLIWWAVKYSFRSAAKTID